MKQQIFPHKSVIYCKYSLIKMYNNVEITRKNGQKT